jgi:hypothetical protein
VQICAFRTDQTRILDETTFAKAFESVHIEHMTKSATARKQSAAAPQESNEDAQERFRVAALKSLIAELKHGAQLSREEFGKLFGKAQRVLELDDFAIARALQISRPTVGRWVRGESAPHPLGRRPALPWLAREAQHRLKQH